jgi:sulfatase maturation enzyme AslB (radical SAM superfamily)
MEIGHLGVDTMEKISRFMIAQHNSIRLNFTGGEPILYIDNILNLLERIKDIRSNMANPMIVTNGTLITERVLNDIKEIDKNVVLSISIDGPPEIHNQQRVAKLGSSDTHKLAINALAMIKKAGFEVYVNSVITKLHQDYGLRKYYEYMKSLNVPWLIGKGSFLNYNSALDEKSFVDIVLNLISIWEDDPDDTEATWIDGILAYIINEKEGAFTEHCGSDGMIAFAGEKGYMWPCPRFIPYREHCLGEFSESDFWSCINSKKRYYFEELFSQKKCAYEVCLYENREAVENGRLEKIRLFETIKSKLGTEL